MGVVERKPWTGDDLRQTFRSLYPRPGWRARNLDAHSGRVYDFNDYRDMQALVEVAWDDHYTSGFFKGKRVFDAPGDISAEAFVKACREVEDLCAVALNERRDEA